MKQTPHTAAKRALRKQHACYVLVTCQKPSWDGDMQVEMSYEGDPLLASLLLEQAHQRMRAEEQEQLTMEV